MIHWARHCSHLHRPTQVGDAIADMHERQTAKATLQKNSVMYVARIAHLVHRATRKFKQIGERNLRSQLAIARLSGAMLVPVGCATICDGCVTGSSLSLYFALSLFLTIYLLSLSLSLLLSFSPPL